MACKQCGGATKLVVNEGSTTEGPFRETYQCVNCEATGTIQGDVEDYENWRRSGRVFNE